MTDSPTDGTPVSFDFGPLDDVWDIITEELVTLQNQASEGFERPIFNPYTDEQVGTLKRSEEMTDGGIVNPMCGYPVAFDSTCAARVFATAFDQTGNQQWRARSESALESVTAITPYTGVPEPRWDPIGWHFAEGSLSVTGTVLDFHWAAASTLDDDAPRILDDQAEALASYLERCRHGRGQFAHNAVPPGSDAGDVQNTNAFALFLRTHAGADNPIVERRLGDNPMDCVNHLIDGQRSDGFWPYIYPGCIQQALYRWHSIRGALRNKFLRKTVFRGDDWIMMGDSAHHCYVLYYLLRAFEAWDEPLPDRVIQRAWNWINEHIVKASNGGYRFDFDWEPKPNYVRYCNFYDTTTYFLVLGTLPLLEDHNVLSEEVVYDISTGLIRYIRDELVDRTETPCIRPHECSYDVQRRILPAVWGGVALKGALLANFIDAYF